MSSTTTASSAPNASTTSTNTAKPTTAAAAPSTPTVTSSASLTNAIDTSNATATDATQTSNAKTSGTTSSSAAADTTSDKPADTNDTTTTSVNSQAGGAGLENVLTTAASGLLDVVDPKTSESKTEGTTADAAEKEKEHHPDHDALAAIPTLRESYANGTLSPKSYVDRISLVQGDITQLKVDAIVNAANSSLLGSKLETGVDGAVHKAAGPELLEACKRLKGCDTGDAKITHGFNLPAKFIIHTVGPAFSWHEEEVKAERLASCYRRCLHIAVDHSLKSIAFPSISTGDYGYPIKAAVHIALKEARHFLDSELGQKLDRVIFVVHGEESEKVYKSIIPEYFPPPGAR